MKFIVTKKAQRPANMNGKCFYCHQPIGSYHKSDCVLIVKKVKVKLVINYEVTVPAHWDKSNVEFHRNLGTWCSSNLIEELKKIDKKGCLCPLAEFEYLEDTGKPMLKE